MSQYDFFLNRVDVDLRKPTKSRARQRWALVSIFSFPFLVLALAAQQSATFAVNGQQGSIDVFQYQGRNYIGIDGLARLLNGSVSYHGSQVVLTVPGLGSTTPSPASAPPDQTGLSKTYLTAAIEAAAQIREWHSALRTAIERGIPLNTGWLTGYQNKTQVSLSLASVAVNTDADKNVNQLLVNLFNSMKTLTNNYVQLASSQTYFPTNALDSDSLDQSIVACGHSLAAMAAARQFVNDGSCQ